MSEWISVRTELPPDGITVLVKDLVDEGEIPSTAEYCESGWKDYLGNHHEYAKWVSCWGYIPK